MIFGHSGAVITIDACFSQIPKFFSFKPIMTLLISWLIYRYTTLITHLFKHLPIRIISTISFSSFKFKFFLSVFERGISHYPNNLLYIVILEIIAMNIGGVYRRFISNNKNVFILNWTVKFSIVAPILCYLSKHHLFISYNLLQPILYLYFVMMYFYCSISTHYRLKSELVEEEKLSKKTN
eukprot:TRINITY_DN1159_c0_g3_i1.p1 TRINITY_DN1159_c0_g3~~TRINITY_DN1159_c0_g3_i1.p1  ORF type:complete len:181 (+),score=1.73 TRINITY_DN1159_c0_g3_i1:124-666(+)